MEKMISRGIHTMEVTVAEAPMQQATFRSRLPRNEEEYKEFEKPRITIPSPCLASDDD